MSTAEDQLQLLTGISPANITQIKYILSCAFDVGAAPTDYICGKVSKYTSKLPPLLFGGSRNGVDINEQYEFYSITAPFTCDPYPEFMGIVAIMRQNGGLHKIYNRFSRMAKNLKSTAPSYVHLNDFRGRSLSNNNNNNNNGDDNNMSEEIAFDIIEVMIYTNFPRSKTSSSPSFSSSFVDEYQFEPHIIAYVSNTGSWSPIWPYGMITEESHTYIRNENAKEPIQLPPISIVSSVIPIVHNSDESGSASLSLIKTTHIKNWYKVNDQQLNQCYLEIKNVRYDENKTPASDLKELAYKFEPNDDASHMSPDAIQAIIKQNVNPRSFFIRDYNYNSENANTNPNPYSHGFARSPLPFEHLVNDLSPRKHIPLTKNGHEQTPNQYMIENSNDWKSISASVYVSSSHNNNAFVAHQIINPIQIIDPRLFARAFQGWSCISKVVSPLITWDYKIVPSRVENENNIRVLESKYCIVIIALPASDGKSTILHTWDNSTPISNVPFMGCDENWWLSSSDDDDNDDDDDFIPNRYNESEIVNIMKHSIRIRESKPAANVNMDIY